MNFRLFQILAAPAAEEEPTTTTPSNTGERMADDVDDVFDNIFDRNIDTDVLGPFGDIFNNIADVFATAAIGVATIVIFYCIARGIATSDAKEVRSYFKRGLGALAAVILMVLFIAGSLDPFIRWVFTTVF